MLLCERQYGADYVGIQVPGQLTINGTPLNIWYIELDANLVHVFNADIIFRKQDNTVRGGKQISCIAYRAAGPAALHTTREVWTAMGTGYNATFTVSGNNLHLTVTGKTGENLLWSARITHWRT